MKGIYTVVSRDVLVPMAGMGDTTMTTPQMLSLPHFEMLEMRDIGEDRCSLYLLQCAHGVIYRAVHLHSGLAGTCDKVLFPIVGQWARHHADNESITTAEIEQGLHEPPVAGMPVDAIFSPKDATQASAAYPASEKDDDVRNVDDLYRFLGQALGSMGLTYTDARNVQFHGDVALRHLPSGRIRTLHSRSTQNPDHKESM